MSQTKWLWLVVAIFVIASAVLFVQARNLQKEVQQDRVLLEQHSVNKQILDFTQAFIDKVLRAKGEVSFDDRLQLESMVRDLKDDAILAEWTKFVNSQTPAEAQEEVKNLLYLLAQKVQP